MAGIKWSESLVDTAKKILQHHKTVGAALVDLRKATQLNITACALRKGFKRIGEEPPATFLKPENPEVSPRDYLVKRIEAREASRKRHQEGLTAILVEKITAAVEGLKPTTVRVVREVPPNTIPDGDSELIWCEVSDVQLGTKVDYEKMGGINRHDWTVFLAKLAAWKDCVKTTIRERRTAVPIEGVVFAFLGDIVEGHGIFKGQQYELDYDIYQQVMHGAEDFSHALIDITRTFPEINFTFYGVGGNHGRIGSYGEAPYRANFDLILYEFMRLRVEAAGVPNIVFHIPQAWFQVVETWNWTHLLVHGDDIKGFAGLPFYGLQRAIAKYNQVLQRPINYLHIGHFHSEAGISSSLGDCIINGNFIGANSFSKQIIEANVPVQLIHGISQKNGVEWTRKAYLRSREDMKPRLTIYRHGRKPTK
jgi:hypothetical protein